MLCLKILLHTIFGKGYKIYRKIIIKTIDKGKGVC